MPDVAYSLDSIASCFSKGQGVFAADQVSHGAPHEGSISACAALMPALITFNSPCCDLGLALQLQHSLLYPDSDISEIFMMLLVLQAVQKCSSGNKSLLSMGHCQ